MPLGNAITLSPCVTEPIGEITAAVPTLGEFRKLRSGYGALLHLHAEYVLCDVDE